MAKKDKNETKECRFCKTEIPRKAKVCPNCRKKQKRGILKWVVIVLALFVIIGAVSGSDEDNSSNRVSKVGEVSSDNEDSSSLKQETDTEETEALSAIVEEGESSFADTEITETEKIDTSEEEETGFYVGDIIQDGDMQIVYAASGVYVEDNELMQPDEGYQYIYIKLSCTNTGTSGDESISFYSFECYADGYAADQYYSGEDALSATLSAGRSVTGYVYFTVPENAADIEIEYETNYWTAEKIKFIYEGEKDSGYIQEASLARSEDAFSVGDIIETSKFNITYISCEDWESDNQFIKAADGYKFISLEFEFENISDSDASVSYYSFYCYADGINCDASYYRDDALSATLSAGRKAKGTVTFEVPVDAEVIEVEYENNFWTSNRIVFTAK